MSVAAPDRSKAAPATASKQRLRLWLRLLRATRAIEGELRERLRTTFDVTLPQFDVMAALARKPAGLTMGELSRELMVSNGNVTGIIDRLVGDGLVARRQIAEDRRSFAVTLTRKGAARFAQMAEVHEGWVDELLGEIDRSEAATMIDRLDPVAERGLSRNRGA